jgi:hypothetical protein
LKHPGAGGKPVPVEAIVVGDRARKDLGDIDELAASIDEHGLLHPVVIDGSSNLIAGERRLAAVKSLGWGTVAVTVADNLDTAARRLAAERDENCLRKEFTRSEMVAVSKRLVELEAADAKRRQQKGGRAGGEGSGKLPEASKGQTRDKVADAVGVSGRTLEKATAVVDAAADESLPDEVREVAAEAVAEMDETGRVSPAYDKVRDAIDPPEPEHRFVNVDGLCATCGLSGPEGVHWFDEPGMAGLEDVAEPELPGSQPGDQVGGEPVDALPGVSPAPPADSPKHKGPGEVPPRAVPASETSSDEEPGDDEVYVLALLREAVGEVEGLERVAQLGPFNEALSRLSSKVSDLAIQRADDNDSTRYAAEHGKPRS